jgi:phage-related protein
MQKLVDQAKMSFGADIRTGDASSILGSAYAMANGMPDAFKQAFSEGVISESVTPFITKISTIMGGLNVDAIWIEAGRSATEAMIGEMKRKLRALKGDLYDEFKTLFAGMGAEYNKLFPELEDLAKKIARIEAIRSQSGGGAGDSATSPTGSGYDSLGKERIMVKSGEHLARKPVEDISSAMDPKKFSFFGILAEGAENLAKALGPVKTAILGAVGVIAGFFVLKGIFTTIAIGFGKLMTVVMPFTSTIATAIGAISVTAAAIVAAVGVVIGVIIYMYIKFKWFRDMVNDTFKSVIDFFKTGFQMLKDPVMGFLGAVWDGVKQIFDSLFGPIIDFGKKIVLGVLGAIAGVVIAIVGVLRGITIALDFIKVPLFNIIGFVINLATGVVGVLADIISGAIDFIYKIIGAVFTVGIGGPIKLIVEAFKLAFDIIVGIIKIAIDLIIKTFDFLKGGLSGPFEVGFGIIKGVFDKIKSIVSGAIDFIKGVFSGFDLSKIFDGVGGVFGNIISVLQGVGETILNILIAPFKILFDVFKAIASNPIVVFFARLAALIGLVAAVVATWGIKIVLESTWYIIKKVVGALVDLADFIIGGLVSAFNIIKDVAVKAWDFIYGTVKGFIDWWHENVGSLWLIFVAGFVIIYEVVRRFFGYMKDVFGPLLAKVWDAFVGALGVAWEFLKTVGSWISNVFSTVWDAVGTIAVAVFKGIMDALGVAWEVMKTVGSWIGSVFGAAWGLLKKAASLYWDYLSFVIPLFWDTLKKVASWIGTAFSKVWDVISYVATHAFEILGDAIGFVWGILKTVGSWIGTVFSKAWGVVSDVATKAFKILGDAIGFVWGIITGGWSGIKPVFDWIVDIVGNVIKTQIEGLGVIFGFLWSGIMAGWDFIKPVFNWIADIVGNVIKTQVEGLKVIFGFLWDGIQVGWDLVGPVFGWIADIIGNVIKAAIDVVIDVWNFLWRGIKNSWNFLKPIFDLIKDAITGGIGFAIDLIKAGWGLFVTALTNTKDFIMGIMESIGGFIKDKIQFVIEKVIGVWNGLKDAFSAVWMFIQPIISKIGDAIKNVIGGAIGFIGDLIAGIPDAFKAVINGVSGLFNKVVDTLGGFGFPDKILGVPLPFGLGGKKINQIINLPYIPKLYSGGKVGMYMKGGMAYASGGMTYGPAQQGIPAILHGGEYIINHKAAQRIGTDTLDRLNNFKLSKPNFPNMPSVPSINMSNMKVNNSTMTQPSGSSTQNVNIYVDNFIGEPEWFNSMMKGYNTKVLPRNQKSAGLESRVINTYNGLNRGL